MAHTKTKALPALMATLVAVGCGGSVEAIEEAGPDAVVLTAQDVAVVGTRSVGAGSVLTGTLEPYRVVEVRAQVPGVISDLHVDDGDAVREGQVVARIQAEGIRGQAASARAAVAAAEANLALARRQLDSMSRLHEAGAISDLEFQEAQAGYEAAEAQLSAAQAQALAAGESARRATVVSPIAGEVSLRSVSEGEAVDPGDDIVTVVNSSYLELHGQVPASEVAQIGVGMPVELTVDAYPGRVFSGSVARIESTVDPGTRQVGVYVRLPNQERRIVGGLFAVGRVLTGQQKMTAVVPLGAVRGAGEESYVWAIRDGAAVRVPVEVGARNVVEGVVEIDAGLAAGETVIVAPGDIREGVEVRVEGDAVAVPDDRTLTESEPEAGAAQGEER